MPRCAFYTAQLTQCTRHAHDGNGHCWTHTAKAGRLGPRAAGTCPCVIGNHWCGRPLPADQPICAYHTARIEMRDRRQADQEQHRLAVAHLTETFMVEDPRPHWRQVVEFMVERAERPHGHPEALPIMTAMNVARRFYNLTAPPQDLLPRVFTDAWFGEPEGPPVAVFAPPVPALGRLALDDQSVHREVVVTQTNTNVEILLEAAEGALPEEDPMRWATIWWLQKPSVDFQQYLRVIDDVNAWFTKRTCKSSGDYLYKRVFTGVIAKLIVINDDELRGELVKRLWQECYESLGMCCEGHISRLANVFVGFDAAFKSPASPNEMLQTQLAEIAQLKLRPETKLAKAREVMDALGIPIADRAPWLEALEE